MTSLASQLSHPKYRPDIDGLRALAVLSVVAFHAFPSLVQGGFIGVDVFFVISGFLISTIIFENLGSGTFSFFAFFSRRIRRIFPALVVVLAFCLTFGWLSLLPDELNQLGKHVAAGAGFLSNLVLWGESGYFDNSAETKPLVHLWSLGIEEQFYIVWPFLLWAAWKCRLNLSWVTSLLLVASFALNLWWVNNDPVAAFYSPPTRFWELLCGALLAWYSLRKADGSSYRSETVESRDGRFCLSGPPSDAPRRLSNALSMIGAASLMGGFLLMNRDLSFPGYWALLPVSGAAMIVFAGPDAWFNRKILSNKIFVWFGLMSFPLYLWHWPLLSFGRILYFDTPPLRFRIPAVMASIALAWLTVRFIERPLRFGDQKSRLKVFVLSASLVVLAVVGVVFHKSDFSESHSFEKLRLREKGEHAIGSSISWYRGQDDWLFLGNAWSNTVAKLKLAVTPNESNVKDVKARFLKITEAGERFGVRTVLILGANKANIYPEYLPPGLTPSETKYSSFFLDKLREIPHLVVYDPTPDLLAAKPSEGFLYWKTDTHWNNKGAYLAYIGCLEQLNISAPRVTFKPGTSHRGDLIAISRLRNFPLPTDDNWDVVWKETPVWSEKEIPEGKKNIAFGPCTRVMNKRPLSNQTVWVVGDSFTAAIRQYFNATFREVRYVGHWAENINTLPDAIIKAERAPDFIFFVIAERSF